MTAFIISKEQFQQFRAAFKSKTRTTSADILLYNIIRNKDPKRGFTPITSPTKLLNGMWDWQSFSHAMELLSVVYMKPRRFITTGIEYPMSKAGHEYRETYGDLLTPEVCEQITAVLKACT